MSTEPSGETQPPYPVCRMGYFDWKLPEHPIGVMCVHLRVEHGMGYRSIAKRLGWTETKVRKCLTAAADIGREGQP